MVLANQESPTAKTLAEQLLAERAAIEHFVDIVAALEQRVQGYEQQFGLPSNEIHNAIESGKLAETADVCDWILDYELLQRAKAVVR